MEGDNWSQAIDLIAAKDARIAELEAENEALRAKLEVLDENRHRWFADAETDYHSFYRIHGVEKRFHHIAELADALAAAKGE